MLITRDPTVTNGDGSESNSFTANNAGDTVTVKLGIGNQGGDYDGSEALTRVLVEGVPDGVIVQNADFIGSGQWLQVRDDKFDDDNNLTDEIKFDVLSTAGGLEDESITITVSTEDDGNGTVLNDSTDITLTTNFTGDTNSDSPAEIEQWEATTFEPTEDQPFNLDDAIDGKIEDGVTDNGITITLTDLPADSDVTGMTETMIDGETVYTASTEGGNSELQSLLEGITVTSPPEWNSNNHDFQYDAKLTTYIPSGKQAEETITVDQDVTPVSDEPDVNIKASAVDEGDDLTFSFDIGNTADDPDANWSLVNGKLYLQVDDSEKGGTLKDTNGNALQSEQGSNVDGLDDGEYYVVENVDSSTTVDVTYNPDGLHTSGSVTLDGWIQSQENGAANPIFGTGSQTGEIKPVNSGYDFSVDSASGTENPEQQVKSGKENAIKLNITDNGLIDDDGSESLQTVLLSDLPDGFLVYVGDDEQSATEADLSNNAGGDGTTNTWLLGSDIPNYVAIMPPQYWSGTLSDLKLQVISGEKELSTADVTTETFELTVDARADGLTIDPTPSFGDEGDVIDLNLNHELDDPEKVELGESYPEDESKETLTLEFTGMGEHAAFYADLNNDGEQTLISGTDKVAYNEAEETYTVSGLTSTQAETLGFKQAVNALDDDVQVEARTEESGNDSVSSRTDSKTIEAKDNINEQFGTSDANNLLYTGDNLDGRGGDDTVQLRFGESADGDDLGSNLDNIEELEMSGNGENAINSLSVQDVLDMTDENNELKISGDSEDTLGLDAGSNWQEGDSTDGYISYTGTFNGSDEVTLKVDETLTVE